MPIVANSARDRSQVTQPECRSPFLNTRAFSFLIGGERPRAGGSVLLGLLVNLTHGKVLDRVPLLLSLASSRVSGAVPNCSRGI